MTTTTRRTALFGTLLAVALAVLSARSDARDSPVIDTRKNTCQTSVTTEFVQQVPTDRHVVELLKLAPGVNFAPERATVTVQLDGRQRVNNFVVDGVSVDGQTMRMDFDSINFNAAGCWYKGLTPRTEFGSGYSGKIQMEVRTRPNLRMFWNVKDLRGPGGPIKKDKLFFFLPASTFAEQPPSDTPPTGTRPEDTTVPVPGDDTPGFTGWQPRVGLTIRDFGRFSGSFKPRQHSPEECAKHRINGVALCEVLGSGNTTVEVFNLTPSGFGYRGVGATIPNLSFGDGYCNRDRCETQGTFYGQPVRKTLDGWRESGADLLADTTVFFNQSQFRLDYRGTYSAPGSTGTALPFPSVPSVPVLPPAQPTDPSGFKIRDDMLLNGTTLDLKVSADYHPNHEGHFFPSVGHYLCLRIPGNWQVKVNDVTENSFKLRLPSSDPRVFYEQLADCERTSVNAASCSWNGSVHGQDLRVRSDLSFLPGRRVSTNILFGRGNDQFSASGTGTWK